MFWFIYKINIIQREHSQLLWLVEIFGQYFKVGGT